VLKNNKAASDMEISAQISWELNQEKMGRPLRCIIDFAKRRQPLYREETGNLILLDVDNEVLIDASKILFKVGDFVAIKLKKRADLIFVRSARFKYC